MVIIILTMQIYIPQLDAGFEVFVCTAAFEDVTLRKDLLHQLLRLLKNHNYRTLECSVYLHALKECEQWTCSCQPTCGM